eukprot:IDg14429t1
MGLHSMLISALSLLLLAHMMHRARSAFVRRDVHGGTRQVIACIGYCRRTTRNCDSFVLQLCTDRGDAWCTYCGTHWHHVCADFSKWCRQSCDDGNVMFQPESEMETRLRQSSIAIDWRKKKGSLADAGGIGRLVTLARPTVPSGIEDTDTRTVAADMRSSGGYDVTAARSSVCARAASSVATGMGSTARRTTECDKGLARWELVRHLSSDSSAVRSSSIKNGQ